MNFKTVIWLIVIGVAVSLIVSSILSAAPAPGAFVGGGSGRSGGGATGSWELDPASAEYKAKVKAGSF